MPWSAPPLIPQNAVVGVAPGGPTLVLPDMETRLSQLEQSVGLLLAGTPLPPDVQRAQACTQVSPQPLGRSALAQRDKAQRRKAQLGRSQQGKAHLLCVPQYDYTVSVLVCVPHVLLLVTAGLACFPSSCSANYKLWQQGTGQPC